MMNKKIRRLIDDIFSDMKMTADNLALRDEMMANAQARYEDSVRQGKTEEEAFAEVAASLGDVQSLLKEMNAQDGGEQDVPNASEEPKAEETEEPKDAEANTEKKAQDVPDLGEALGKAFGALGDMGKQIMPQAQKLVKQVDGMTGGVIGGIGKVVGKGLSDAQKAAGKAIDKLSGDKGEIVIDLGKIIVEPDEKKESPKAPAALRKRAQDIRAEAEIKQAAGDQEGARQLRAKAYAMETEADEMEKKLADIAAKKAEEAEATKETEEAAEVKKPEEKGTDFDSLMDEMAAVTKELNEMDKKLGQTDEDADEDIDLDAVVRDAEEAARDADRQAEEKKTTARPMEGQPGMVIVQRFPAAGLREISIKLDADDVTIKDSDEPDVVVKWEAEDEDAIQPNMVCENHKLTINRNNPDVFKTFFSVFKKEGGKVTVRVPRGYAADYEIGTTSGDIKLYAIDVDRVKVNTTSGSVRIEPDPGIRAKEISVTSISGDATVSACAGDVSVTTVSGKQFVSCDANRASVSVVSGKAHVEGACEEWEINSVSGGVELICTVAPTNRIQLSTVSGNARVTLPSDIRGFVADMSSMSGRIVNEFGPNRYGTCALPIHMDTMSGKLMITRL